MAHYRLFFDGSCGPKNPGGTAAYGYALFKDGEEEPVSTGHGVIGTGPAMSNNLAEFESLDKGMNAFALRTLVGKRDPGDLAVFGDSKLVINVMNRFWTPKPDRLYLSAYEAALRTLKAIRRNGVRVTFDWVPREQNTYCDTLSKADAKCDKMAQINK